MTTTAHVTLTGQDLEDARVIVQTAIAFATTGSPGYEVDDLILLLKACNTLGYVGGFDEGHPANESMFLECIGEFSGHVLDDLTYVTRHHADWFEGVAETDERSFSEQDQARYHRSEVARAPRAPRARGVVTAGGAPAPTPRRALSTETRRDGVSVTAAKKTRSPDFRKVACGV